MTSPGRYALLVERMAELRAEASPGPLGAKLRDFDALLYDRDTNVIAQFRDGSLKHKANVALAQPAHEYAACVVALAEIVSTDGFPHHVPNCGSCKGCRGMARLADLARAMGVEVGT